MRDTQFSSALNDDKSYYSWIVELTKRYRSSQIKAATKVNEDMLRFYWSVGEDIEKKQWENLYGSHFYENLSKDLKRELGIKCGLSPSTLKYMRYFYKLYSQVVGNRQQLLTISISSLRFLGHTICVSLTKSKEMSMKPCFSFGSHWKTTGDVQCS